MHRFIYLCCLATALSACASAPTPDEIAAADYGREMTPEQCRTIAKEIVSARLRDPESVQLRYDGDCYRGWSGKVPLAGMPSEFGYVQKGSFNAKNGFGGYAGFKDFYVLVRNGRGVVAAMADGEYNIMVPYRP